MNKGVITKKEIRAVGYYYTDDGVPMLDIENDEGDTVSVSVEKLFDMFVDSTVEIRVSSNDTGGFDG